MRNQVSQTKHVGIPLPGKLVSLDRILVFALRVIAEILPIPQLADVGLLRLMEQLLIRILR